MEEDARLQKVHLSAMCRCRFFGIFSGSGREVGCSGGSVEEITFLSPRRLGKKYMAFFMVVHSASSWTFPTRFLILLHCSGFTPVLRTFQTL